MNTRVLKAHVDAVENCINEALAIRKATNDNRGFAERIALAAITATDSKPSYLAVVLEGNRQLFFGEFKSTKAARKAIERGCVGTRRGATGYVAPLIPAPKLKNLGDVEEYITDKEWD